MFQRSSESVELERTVTLERQSLAAIPLRKYGLNAGPVDSFPELCEAFRLVYRNYAACNYQSLNRMKMRYSVHQILPSCTALVARVGVNVVGTGSLVTDSVGGLPSESVFHDIFDRLRDQGRHLAEATALACHGDNQIKAAYVSLNLIPVGIALARARGVDDWCVTVNPKHLRFWVDTLGLNVLSAIRQCGHVGNHPGILLRIPLREMYAGDWTYTDVFSDEILPKLRTANIDTGFKLTSTHVAHLLRARSDLAAELTENQRNMFEYYYPGINSKLNRKK